MHAVKSKVIEKGYINIYSQLTEQEKRQIKYKTLYKKQNSEWDESMVFLAKEFAKYNNKPALVLDAGCGNGNYVLDENQNLIEKAVGVDLKPEFTEKNISVDEIIHSNLETLSFDDNTFDIVTSLWVLEHLENPTKVFKEVSRVLKPGGIFMFVTPNKNYIPLQIIHTIKSLKTNHILNKWLFGRNSSDIFETFYRANTLNDIKSISRKFFELEKLFYNYDPSYTSFDPISFKVSDLLNFTNMKAHIIGILKKPL